MIFPTASGATRCLAELGAGIPDDSVLEIARFALPSLPQTSGSDDAYWTTFYVVLYPTSLSRNAAAFWRDTGDGITSRHAEYCYARLDYLESDSINISLRTQPPKSNNIAAEPSLTFVKSAFAEKRAIESFIATLATSEQAGQLSVSFRDVFLYSKGMSAISAVARALASLSDKSDAVAYGFIYAETNKVIPRSGWGNYTFYGRGSVQELEELERELAAGRRIQALFCDFPGNPHLMSPDLHRIRTLANKYGFIVACDETVGNFVNVDLLPYVDILITSLTKIFSGYSDVMGGSVVVNPRSPYYETIIARLTALYEEANFPLDVVTLARNCADFVPRVHRCNLNTLSVLNLLSAHSSVEEVYHPLIGSRKPIYERYRRARGGYGNVLSIIFREPRSAIRFYDTLDVFKGTSFGTNFTLATPYVQLAHYHEQDWVESYGIPKHIIRLSVGLESEHQILKAVAEALAEVERSENIC